MRKRDVNGDGPAMNREDRQVNWRPPGPNADGPDWGYVGLVLGSLIVGGVLLAAIWWATGGL